MNLKQSIEFFVDKKRNFRPLRWMTKDDLYVHSDDILESAFRDIKTTRKKNGIALLMIGSLLGSYEARNELALLYSAGYDINCSFISRYAGISWWIKGTDLLGLESTMLSNALDLRRSTQAKSQLVCAQERYTNILRLLAHHHYEPAIEIIGKQIFTGDFFSQDRALGLAWSMLANHLELDVRLDEIESMKKSSSDDVLAASESLFRELKRNYKKGQINLGFVCLSRDTSLEDKPSLG